MPPKKRAASARKDPRGAARRLGLRAYARHRGVSLKAVQKAIADGRITRGRDGKIAVEEADREWAQNTRPLPDGAVSESVAELQRRKLLAEAQLKELEFQERLGQLIPLEVHEKRLVDFVGRVNAALRGLKGRWPPHLLNIHTIREGQARLGPLINQLLRELSQMELPHADDDAAA